MPLVHHAAAAAAALVAAHACVDLARAQVPEGAAVVCTYTDRGSEYVPGTPGLFIVPLPGGPVTQVTRITGLPSELTTDLGGAHRQGASSVSLRSSDGAVIVGTIADASGPSAGQVKLYVFHLNGSAVAQTQTILLGTTNDLGQAWTAVAPDGRIFVAASAGQFPLSSSSTQMAGSFTAIVDTSTTPPTFTPLPNPSFMPQPQPVALSGVALDPTGEYAYLALSNFSGLANGLFVGPSQATLFRTNITTQVGCAIHSWPNESVFGIACDDDGRVYVSSTDHAAVQHFIHTVQPNGCGTPTVSTVQSQTPLLAWGLALDRATGWFIAPSFQNRPGFSGAHLNALSMIDPVSGLTLPVASPPPGGWGTIGNQGHGVAVNNQVESYGAASPGQNSYWFENFPNPTGLPTATGGNPGYSLTTRSAPGAPALSAIAMSFGRGATNVMGIGLLVDLASAVTVILPGSPSSAFALPIPNAPGLAGIELCAQSLHLESGGGFAASRGLSLRL